MITIAAKPTSENFIQNYANYIHEFTESRLMVPAVWPSDKNAAVEQVRQAAKESKTLILEWANDFTAMVLQKPLPCKVIVRIHDHEVRKGRIDNINWDHVDGAWFINRDIEKLFLKKYPSVPTFFLPNAIDPAPFKENLSREKKIGLLSLFARTRKRIDRAFDVIRLLKNEGWSLYIRCEGYNPEYIFKAPDLPGNYTFSELKQMSAGLPVFWDLRKVRQKKDDSGQWYGNTKTDVSEFFSDKAVVISTSDHEGFHYAIGQGMLCGSMPAVFHWPVGSPKDFWGNYVCDTAEEMAERIRNYQPSHQYRQYVLSNFHPCVLIPKLIEEIQQIECRKATTY